MLVMTGPLAASAPGDRTKQMAAKRATRRERNDLDVMVVGIGVGDVHLSRLRLHRFSFG